MTSTTNDLVDRIKREPGRVLWWTIYKPMIDQSIEAMGPKINADISDFISDKLTSMSEAGFFAEQEAKRNFNKIIEQNDIF